MADERRKGGWWGVALALAILPVLYVLGLGPAARLVNRGAVGSPAAEAIATFYTPLDWLAETPSLGEPLRWYVSLWQ
jgi:hypothetical protein